MSVFLEQIQRLIAKGEIRVSDHGYDELAADKILVRDIIKGVEAARIVEDYPEYHKVPCALMLQRDHNGSAIHVVWGLPKGMNTPAVLVTAYRPNPELWTDDFLRRKK